jgi:hypothetical protein
MPRKFKATLVELYGDKVLPDLISRVIDAVFYADFMSRRSGRMAIIVIAIPLVFVLLSRGFSVTVRHVFIMGCNGAAVHNQGQH